MRLDDLIVAGAGPERLATGFGFSEGPVWDPAGFLLFSDMPGDVRRRWDEQAGVVEVARPSNKSNGMAFDADGRLVICEHSTSRVIRHEHDGSVTLLASHTGGRELNSPNDVIVSFDGSILFSDPTYGRTAAFGVEREPELEVRGVYRVGPDGGEPELIAGDFAQPNGLCWSPDESVLYVNDTERGHIRTFVRDSDGHLAAGGVFADGIVSDADPGVVDGMKVDALGNVYVTGPGGYWVFEPTGTRIGVIEVPEPAGNLNWGGRDWSTLYLTASSSLYRIEMRVAGAPVPNMRRHAVTRAAHAI
jgi:gluconolactonase